MQGLCGCGKPAKYIMLKNEVVVGGCCNKRGRCPTYEELEEKLRITRSRVRKLQMAAEDVINFKEGTEVYKQAVLIIKGEQ